MIHKKKHNKNIKNAQIKSDNELHLTKHIHFESVDSTNTWSKMHTAQWDAAGVTLVTASSQTSGRGRFKRLWVSPAKLNIYATFCFWLDAQRTDIGSISQVMALAVVQLLENYGFSPTIKWPNDLLLQEKKVAGILCESILEGGRRGVVCGIGLNVNMPVEFLDQIHRPATSLFLEKGRLFDLKAILSVLTNNFLNVLNQFILRGFSPFVFSFQKWSALKRGQFVRFHDNQNFIEARFEQLRSDGSVILRLSNGESKIFYSGEFVSLLENQAVK